MKPFTCTNINKTNEDKIISYDLQDSTGKTIQVSYTKLKLMLESNKIAVVNLTIKNNEIVEDPNYQIKSMIAKLKMLSGGEAKAYKSDCGHAYYVIENPDTTIVYIPDDVEYLIEYDDNYGKPDFCNIKCNTLKVIGGSGLTSTFNMFHECQAHSIDFSLFDTSKVTDMDSMFRGCAARILDLSSFDTSKVTDMRKMFCECKARVLELSSFNTSNVEDMSWMFSECLAQSLDLSSFDTSNVIYMTGMFELFYSQSLLNLSSFDTSKVIDMNSMFMECQAESIDLSSFDISNVTDTGWMFSDCQAQIKATDIDLLDHYKYKYSVRDLYDI